MIRTFSALTRVNPGFAAPNSLQTFRINIPETQIPDGDGSALLHREQEIRDRLATIPGVSDVAITTAVPFDGHTSSDVLFAQDHSYQEGRLPIIRRFIYVSPGSFGVFGTPLVAGRDYTWTDTYNKIPLAIVSETWRANSGLHPGRRSASESA